MLPTTLRLTAAQFDTIIRQARSQPEEEVCGLLGGQGEQVLGVYPVRNTSPTPAVHFLMDDQTFVTSYLDIEDHGWDLVAIYHSHPRGMRPYPSSTDVANANYPEALNLIVAFDVQGQPDARVFQIADGQVREVDLKIAGPQS